MGQLYDLTRSVEFVLPTKKVSADYQRDAKKALKGRWGVAILAMLIAALFGVSGSMTAWTSGGSTSSTDTEIEETTEVVEEEVDITVDEFIVGASFVAVAVLAALFVSALITGPVQVGYERFNLNLFTGKQAKVKTLFSYFKAGRWGKSARLYLRYMLVLFFYMLPAFIGTIMMICGAYVIELSEGVESNLLVGGVGLAVIGFVIAIISEIRYFVALYKYSMAFKVFAENPSLSPRKAMKKSKELMKGNKWAFFCLHCSYIGWSLLASLTCGIAFIWLVPQIRASEAAFYRNISLRRKLGLN